MDEQVRNADLHGNKWCSKFWHCMFSAQDEKLPGVKDCLHNLYKYLFFLFLSYFGVIMYSQVKRWTPTHLWNARSAFLCRISCTPRKAAEERVQLVSGKGGPGVFNKYKTHQKSYTFSWVKSNRCWVPTCPVLPQALLKTVDRAWANPRPVHSWGRTVEWCQGWGWAGESLLVPRGIGGPSSKDQLGIPERSTSVPSHVGTWLLGEDEFYRDGTKDVALDRLQRSSRNWEAMILGQRH